MLSSLNLCLVFVTCYASSDAEFLGDSENFYSKGENIVDRLLQAKTILIGEKVYL